MDVAVKRRIDSLEKIKVKQADAETFSMLNRLYHADPVGYATFLGFKLTPHQELILESLLKPPFKVLVPSGNSLGKSYIAALAIHWWFFCRGPSIVLSTAPTHQHVVDVLWTEVRMQVMRAGLPDYFIGPAAPVMRNGHDWYAMGFTTRTPEAYGGRHRDRTLFVKDESTDIPPDIWHRERTMFDPNPEAGHAALAIFNPITTNCQAYIEYHLVDDNPSNPPWTVIRLNGLEHPNIRDELEGRPRSIPGAVSCKMIEGWLRDYCETVDRAEDREVTDIEYPPSHITHKPGLWYRPGPEFQAACLGLWPSQGDGVWSDALWSACMAREGVTPMDGTLPVIGIDTAMGKGADWHAIHGRWGSVSLLHETANVMDPVKIFGRTKEACEKMAKIATGKFAVSRAPVQPKDIKIQIDDDGTGGAVAAFLRRDGYNAIAIGAGTTASKPDRYPRRRDEVWFQVADRAKKGLVCTGRLDRATQQRLRHQLLAPTFDFDGRGRRVVQSKDEVRDLIGRSPDDADAFNLAYYETGGSIVPTLITPEPKQDAEKEYGRPTERKRGRWA